MELFVRVKKSFSSIVEYAKKNYSPFFFGFFLLFGIGKVVFENNGVLYFEQVFYSAMIIVWWLIVERRLISKRMKISIRVLAGSMVLLLILQLFRYDILYQFPAIARYCWYGYYIPFTLFPMLLFYIICSINTNEYEPIDKKNYLAIIPAAFNLVLVFTNDFHEYVFKFDPNYPIEAEKYTHNWGYYLVLIWFVVLTILCVVVIVRQTRLSRIWHRLIVPAIPIVIGGTLSILIMTGRELVILDTKIYNIPEIQIFTTIAVLEGLIQVGLLPSNRQYKRFFEKSTLLVQIEDVDGDIKYSSDNARELEHSVSAGYVKQEDYRLQHMLIPGGSVYWVDDYTEINVLNHEIQGITDALKEGNELKKSENSIKTDEARYEALNSIYDEISSETAEQAAKIRQILEDDDSEQDFRHRLSLAAIYNAYIKRQSNLILLARTTGAIDSKELVLALNETTEFLRYYGINAAVNYGKKVHISSTAVIETYRLVQKVIDHMIPDAKSCYIHVDTSSKDLKVRMMIDGATSLPENSEHIKVDGDTISAVITISFDKKEGEEN